MAKRKIFTVLLLSFLCIFAVNLTACGKKNKNNNNNNNSSTSIEYSYKKQGNGYVLTSYTGTSSNAVIPDEIDGHKITAIADDCFKNNTTLFTVELGSNISAIGNNAFAGCSGLHHIVLPNTVTAVGENAFGGCSSMTQILIENKASAETWGETWKGDTAAEVVYISDIFDYVIEDNKVTITEYKRYLRNLIIPETIEGSPVVNIGKILTKIFSLDSLWLPKTITNFGQNLLPDIGYNIPELVGDRVSEVDGPVLFSSLYYGGTIEDWFNIKWFYSDISNESKEFSNPMFFSDKFYWLDENGEYEEPTDVVIPDGVTEIRALEFAYLRSLTSIIIPDSVTKIGFGAFGSCINLNSVAFLGSVNEIGDSAFIYCMSLTEINIPDGVTYIGEDAFNETALKKLIIPDTVEEIGYDAFFDCPFLTRVTIGKGVKEIGEDAFMYCQIVEIYNFSDLDIQIGSEDFGGIALNAKAVYKSVDAESKLFTDKGVVYYIDGEEIIAVGLDDSYATEIKFNEGCTSIEDFSLNDLITSITIPSSVKSINLYGSTHLVEIYNLSDLDIERDSSDFGGIAKYAKVIHKSADEPSKLMTSNGVIYYCDGDEKIAIISTDLFADELKIDNNCTKIEPEAFNTLVNLKSLTIPGSVKFIGEWTFVWCSGLKEVVFEEGVVEIDSAAFGSCINLQNITLPASITTINSGAFKNCFSLSNVYYNGTLEDWCQISFDDGYQGSSNPMYYADHFYLKDGSGNYTELTEITIPETITGIKPFNFLGFNNVTKVVIHENVEYIGYLAFEDCYRLAEIYNLSGLEIQLGSNDFGNIAVNAKVIHESLDEPSRLITSNGVVYYADDDEKVAIEPVNMNATEIVLDSDCTEIDNYAFYNCIDLRAITMPEGIEVIGEYAFWHCVNLRQITIPASVTKIGEYAFRDCYGLNYVYYNGTMETWHQIDFNNNYDDEINSLNNVEHFYMKDSSGNYTELTEIVIPENVTEIQQNYFNSLKSIKTVKIHNNVTSICVDAFDVWKDLSIYYGGTLEDWCKIEFYTNIPSFGHVVANLNNKNYSKYLYIQDGSGNYTELTEVVIPDSITEIKNCTFYRFSHIKSVVIHDNVTSIGGDAFYECTGLTDVTIGSGVETIEINAFGGCDNLIEVIFEDAHNWFNSKHGSANIDNIVSDPAKAADFLKYKYGRDNSMYKNDK